MKKKLNKNTVSHQRIKTDVEPCLQTSKILRIAYNVHNNKIQKQTPIV